MHRPSSVLDEFGNASSCASAAVSAQQVKIDKLGGFLVLGHKVIAVAARKQILTANWAFCIESPLTTLQLASSDIHATIQPGKPFIAASDCDSSRDSNGSGS
jgi:hypothetical protein